MALWMRVCTCLAPHGTRRGEEHEAVQWQSSIFQGSCCSHLLSRNAKLVVYCNLIVHTSCLKIASILNAVCPKSRVNAMHACAVKTTWEACICPALANLGRAHLRLADFPQPLLGHVLQKIESRHSSSVRHVPDWWQSLSGPLQNFSNLLLVSSIGLDNEHSRASAAEAFNLFIGELSRS